MIRAIDVYTICSKKMQPSFEFLPCYANLMTRISLNSNAVFVFNKLQITDCIIILGFAVIVIVEFYF
jgi:hypothetical protein